jgi:hypothetical protein
VIRSVDRARAEQSDGDDGVGSNGARMPPPTPYGFMQPKEEAMRTGDLH